MTAGRSALDLPARADEPQWVGEVLRFWFADLGREAWFAKSDATDALIRQRFGDLVGAVARDATRIDTAEARQVLATIIVLDQFSRNLYRGSPEAFAYDAAALALADRAVERGVDRELDGVGRLFLYLPFEHSESLSDQHQAVDLITRIGDAEFTRYAVAHLRIVERFGRFPHRNAVLGRPSTAEELAFLAQPGSSF